MAEPITKETLINAEIDAQTWSAILNTDEARVFQTRLGFEVWTYPKIIEYMLSTAFPTVYFATKTALLAQAPDLNKGGYVTSDPIAANNGLYRGNGTAWIKSTFDPLELSKAFSQDLVDGVITQRLLTAAQDYMFAVMGSDGRYAPVIAASGETLTTKNGVTAPTVAIGEHGYVDGPQTQLFNGEPIQIITYDKDNKIINMQTDGSLVTAGYAGAYQHIGHIYKQSQFIGLINNERPFKVWLNAAGEITKCITAEGGLYYANNGVLVRIVGNTDKVIEAPKFALSAQYAPYGEPTRLSVSNIIIYGFGVTGQSNGFGASNGHNETQPAGYPAWTIADDPILASTTLYPANMLMLNGLSPRQFGAVATSFVPIVESRANAGSETILTSMFAHALNKIGTSAGGVMPTFLGFDCAEGGQVYSNLKRGSSSYNNTLVAIKSATDIAKSQGKVFVQAAMFYIGNESDDEFTVNYTVAARAAAMKQRERDMNADIKAITGQTQDCVFFNVQIASAVNTMSGADGAFNQKVKKAVMELDGQTGNRMPAPFYQLQTSGNGSNQIHASCKGMNELGQRCAQWVVNELFGTGSRAFRWIEDSLRWISPTSFILSFDVPVLPIVIDTSNNQVSTTGLGGGMGFYFDDYSGSRPSITSISVVGNDSIQFNLRAAPNNKNVRMSYAMRATQAPPAGLKGPYGPIYGPRGCVRDSVVDVNLYTSQNTYNWLGSDYMYFNYPY